MEHARTSSIMSDTSSTKSGFSRRFSIPFRSKLSSSRTGSIDSIQAKDSLEDATRHRNSTDTISRRLLKKKAPPSKSNTIGGAKTYKPVLAQGAAGYEEQRNPFPVIDVSQAWERDKQTGEIIDHTALIHGLGEHSSSDNVSKDAHLHAYGATGQPGKKVVSSLTPEVWSRVLDYSTPSDVANLAFTCKAFRDLLGFEPWNALNLPENIQHKSDFLVHMDKHYPNHLFCFTCATYHVRIQPGKESLKPTNVLNHLSTCPQTTIPKPRIRLTFGRTLPFTFVQLALRAHNHSPDHGITTESLARRYTDRDSIAGWYGGWSHQTKYAIVKGHLLLRVISTHFAVAGLPPSGLRNLLYSREDFVPYFSVCAHWRDGNLMPSVKCALGHIPVPLEGSGVNRIGRNIKQHYSPPKPIITLCSECRPMRRCPDCPTEYLIELKMAEDKSDPTNLFKQALVVTRWSDLGDGSTPWSPEWAACNGETADFNSFEVMGKRAVSGVFESQYNEETIPGQRMVSMNPDKEKLGEAGHNWY